MMIPCALLFSSVCGHSLLLFTSYIDVRAVPTVGVTACKYSLYYIDIYCQLLNEFQCPDLLTSQIQRNKEFSKWNVVQHIGYSDVVGYYQFLYNILHVNFATRQKTKTKCQIFKLTLINN